MLSAGGLNRIFLIFRLKFGAATHITLDTEWCIYCIRTALVDTITSLQDCDREVIPVLEVHELLTKIHIVDMALSKWVGNRGHILTYLFSSTSRQCHNV